MTLPEPVVGLIVRYSCLWHAEYLEGREEGQKDRPCVLIAAIKTDDQGQKRVLVIPITHNQPDCPAIETPQAVKKRLGLDDNRSWVVLSEWNEFAWPGPDLRPVAGSDPPSFAYGFLPPRFFASVRSRIFEITQSGKARRVPRSE